MCRGSLSAISRSRVIPTNPVHERPIPIGPDEGRINSTAICSDNWAGVVTFRRFWTSAVRFNKGPWRATVEIKGVRSLWHNLSDSEIGGCDLDKAAP